MAYIFSKDGVNSNKEPRVQFKSLAEKRDLRDMNKIFDDEQASNNLNSPSVTSQEIESSSLETESPEIVTDGENSGNEKVAFSGE